MTKRNTKSNDVVAAPASIVLKKLHDDIVRAVPNTTITPKSMRVWLRANMRDVHERNASWTFTQSQYDVVRSHFDPAYAAKIARANKRNAKTNDAPRARKSRVIADNTTNTSAVVTNNEMTPA
jgi:hypothetical protein